MVNFFELKFSYLKVVFISKLRKIIGLGSLESYKIYEVGDEVLWIMIILLGRGEFLVEIFINCRGVSGYGIYKLLFMIGLVFELLMMRM